MKSVIETQAELIKKLQDTNDRFAKIITRFSQEMVALKEAHDHMKFEYQRMVKFYDKQVGTPCEQIRHAQEVEVHKEHIEELTAMIQSQAGVIEKLNFDIQKRGGFVEIDDRKANHLYIRGKQIVWQKNEDAVGIEYRMREAAELVDARAKIGEFRKKIEIMAKMIGDQGQEISTLKELKDSAKWRMEQLATYTLEQGKLVLSLQAKLDGEPCNLDFQREAAKMSAYADKCLTIKEEAMGHAAAMSNDVTALGEKTELLLEELASRNERITYLEEQLIREYAVGDDWP